MSVNRFLNFVEFRPTKIKLKRIVSLGTFWKDQNIGHLCDQQKENIVYLHTNNQNITKIAINQKILEFDL